MDSIGNGEGGGGKGGGEAKYTDCMKVFRLLLYCLTPPIPLLVYDVCY